MPAVFSDRERVNTTPRGAESMFAFLDRVAEPVWDRIRQLIEDWVREYSPADQRDLLGRLRRGGPDLEFIAAYWELVLYHGLKALGFKVCCHPEINGTLKRPDFLVQDDTCSFYLEAKVLGEDFPDRQRDQARDDITHQLNQRVRSERFFVSVQFNAETTRPIPIRRFASAAQSWMDNLSLAQVRSEVDTAGSFGATPWNWQDERSGWSISLTPMLRSDSTRSDGVVGLMLGSGTASYVDDRTPIRKALDEKAYRYGDHFDRPFVIALGIARAFTDDMDIVDALFGDEVFLFNPVTNAGEPVRRPNGLFMGASGPRCRRVSGILVAGYVAPWVSGDVGLKLWKNPWATHPLNCDVGGVATTIERNDSGALIATPATVRTGELLGLPPDWPGPAPAFPRR